LDKNVAPQLSLFRLNLVWGSSEIPLLSFGELA
jgi:hypothetical protein